MVREAAMQPLQRKCEHCIPWLKVRSRRIQRGVTTLSRSVESNCCVILLIAKRDQAGRDAYAMYAMYERRTSREPSRAELIVPRGAQSHYSVSYPMVLDEREVEGQNPAGDTMATI